MSLNRFASAAAAIALLATPAPAMAQAQPAAPVAAKPVAVQGDLLDTLKLDGRFTTFVKAVEATNLTTVVKMTKTLTVFAPTDAAFAAMPEGDLAQLMANKTALQKFVLHHVINAPVEAAKMKGAKGQWPAGAGDRILLDGSDDAALKADGATIIQADVRTATGLLHVVDHVLIAGQGAVDPAPPSSGVEAAAGGTKANP